MEGEGHGGNRQGAGMRAAPFFKLAAPRSLFPPFHPWQEVSYTVQLSTVFECTPGHNLYVPDMMWLSSSQLSPVLAPLTAPIFPALDH